MSSVTRVPETSWMRDDELDVSDARTTLRSFGGRRLAVESFRRFRYGDGFSHSRAVGFQLVLALIPLTIAVVGLSSVVQADRIATVIRETLLSITPGSSDSVVGETLQQGLTQAHVGPIALWLGLATSLVALTATMGQVERGANRIYGVQRDRPALVKYRRALVMALVAGVPLVVGFVAIVAGGHAIGVLAEVYDWPDGLADVARVLRWPVSLLLALTAITVIFRWGPRRRQPAHSWMAVGAGLALVLWLVMTGLLAVFVATSGSFGAVYGPLTAFMALLLWAQLSGVALLLGLAFAAQLEAVRAGVHHGATEDPELHPGAPAEQGTSG
jgi:YihY family inner membrane protein